MRGEALPPLGASRSPLGGKPSRGGSRDCGGAATAASNAAPLLPEGSDALLTVSRSALSGSSKAPFPPDRSFVNDFEWTKTSRDLPANVRPIVEDNKMLQEELRRYKQRLGEQEGTIATLDRTIATLRDELQRQRTQMRECSGVSPAQLLQEQQFRKELRERDEEIMQLQQKANVLLRAKAAVERRLTNDLAAERRAGAALRQQMKVMQEEVADKAKQHRFNQMHIKDLYQRLEPLEAAVAAAALVAQQAPPPPAPALLRKPEVVCKLMLCMVYTQPQPTGAEIAEAAARLALQAADQQAAEQRRLHSAATQLQAAARGFLARRRLAAQHAAATTIQAAARGFLVRQALATIWEAAEEVAHSPSEAANLSPAQRLARRQREAELHYQRRAVAGKTKPQKRLPRRPDSSLRGANTAVEAAARRRGLLPAGGEAVRAGGSTAARRASALTLVASSAGGSGSSPLRRLSSLARPSSRSPGQGTGGLAASAGAGWPGREDAGGRQGYMGTRPSWTGGAAGHASANQGTSSASEAGNAGSPSGSPARHHGGRPSVARVPPLELTRPDKQQLAQAGGQRQQQDNKQRQPRLQQDEEGGQQGDSEGGSPSWRLERGCPPASGFDLLPPSSQPSKRRESLGFGSSKPRE